MTDLTGLDVVKPNESLEGNSFLDYRMKICSVANLFNVNVKIRMLMNECAVSLIHVMLLLKEM